MRGRTPNEGDWCICGGVFGAASGLCHDCGRSRSLPENRWVNDGTWVWLPGRGMVKMEPKETPADA